MKVSLPAALRQAWPLLLTVLQAAMFIVATVIVFIEEARSARLVAAFNGLWFLLFCKWSWDAWRDWRKGLLTMPLSQLHRHIAQGKVKRTTLLELSTILMGIAAMSILTLP